MIKNYNGNNTNSNKHYTLEVESDMPKNWKSNSIYMKNETGDVYEVEVKDDIEDE